MRSISTKKKKIIRRSVSLVVALGMLLNETYIWSILDTIPFMNTNDKKSQITAYAAEETGTDPVYRHDDATGEIRVALADFVEYSAACQVYSTYHQYDKVKLYSIDGSDVFESGFSGLGTESKPFGGSIEIESNTYLTLNLDAPLFNYVYDSVTINNGNALHLSRYYGVESGADKTTPIVAKCVYNDSSADAATWNIDLTTPSDSTEHYLSQFGGFIGTMDDEYGAPNLTLNVTMDTASMTKDDVTKTDEGAVAVIGSGDLGLACGHMDEGAVLTFTYTANRAVSGISTDGGDVGGLVGEMENGAVFNLYNESAVTSGIDITTTAGGSYAGGLVGKNVGGTVNVYNTSSKAAIYPVSQHMTGTSGAGGVYGYYSPASALIGDDTFDTSKYSINCQVNGTGHTGGLFGVLDVANDVTISGDSTVTSSHASGDCTAYGGLIGRYKAYDVNQNLSIDSVTAASAKNSGATYYGGGIGEIEKTAPTYVEFNSFTATTSNAGSLTFGGLVANADNAFVKANGVSVTANGYKGGGLVGTLANGVLQISGTNTITGSSAEPGNGEEHRVGKIVGYRDNGLVFMDAGASCTCGAANVDDVGSWGGVIKLGGFATPTNVLSVSDRAVMIGTNDYGFTSIANNEQFAVTALRFQIDGSESANGNQFVTYANDTKDPSSIASENINLTGTVTLTGTGVYGLTRDNDITSDGSMAKCVYSGTFGNASAAQTITYDTGTIYRHKYNGLFAKLDGGTVQNVTFDGTISVNAKTDMYVGTAAARATGNFSVSNMIVSTAMPYSGGSTLYIGGILGEADGSIGMIDVSNCTVNANITGGNSNAVIGGVIGQISHNLDETRAWRFNTVNVSGKIGNTASGKHGGLVGVITGNYNGNTDNRVLTLNGVSVNGLEVSGSGSEMGGLLGYTWLKTDVNVTSVTIQNNSGKKSTVSNSASGGIGGMVYRATGKWTVTSLDIKDIKITGTGSIGMIVNKGISRDDGNLYSAGNRSAIYLCLPSGYTYNITSATLPSVSVFDELCAYTAPDADSVLRNGNGVISINTTFKTDGSTASGSYHARTAKGASANPNSRYYYNLDTLDSTAPAQLMSWGLNQYACANIKKNFADPFGATIANQEYDMNDYSWYPVDLDKNITVNGTFKFYSHEFELSEDAKKSAETNNSYDRTNLEKNQHYTMHCGLFRNVSNGKTLTVGTPVFQGDVGLLEGGSGVMVCGIVQGGSPTSKAAAKVTGSVSLDGVYVYGAGGTISNYAPLLINKVGNYADMTISNVSSTNKYQTSAAVPYISGDGTYPKAASSLIGDVGLSDAPTGINISFGNIRLDGRTADVTDSTFNAELDSAYGTQRTLFTRSTLLNQFKYSSGSTGKYDYKLDQDWNNGHHYSEDSSHNKTYIGVTYGKEVGYTDADTSTEYYGKEQKYSGSSYYTNPVVPAATSAYTGFGNFLPYVYIPYNKNNNTHQLRVNHAASTATGCGTYNDPYILTSGEKLEDFCKWINKGEFNNGDKICIPTSGLSNTAITGTWCDNKTAHVEMTFDGSNFTGTVGNTTYTISLETMRTYLAGAYYKIPDEVSEITVKNATFDGLGNTQNDYAVFRGVIDGNNRKIINQTGFPLIESSNGSVVKDLTVEAVPNDTITRNGQTKAFGTQNSTDYNVSYGAVIGKILGGDNIIDNVSVSLGSESSAMNISLSGSYAQLVPVGGYVGVVVNGGLIFRNMSRVDGNNNALTYDESLFSNVSISAANNANKSPQTAISDDNRAWLYVNPIVGRVINGYAVTESDKYRPYEEGTRTYQGGTTDEVRYWNEIEQKEVTEVPETLSHVTMQNGTKHYSIADIDDELTKLSASSSTITVPNGQAWFVMSLLVNSGESYHNGSGVGYGNSYLMSRQAKYTDIGALGSSSDCSDYNTVAKDDKLTNKKSSKKGYLYNAYYSNTVQLHNATRTVELSKVTYYLPDGYKGLGNIFQNSDNYRMKISTLNGNGATISQNTEFYFYSYKMESNSNDGYEFEYYYPGNTTNGFGLINAIKSYNDDKAFSNITLTGNVFHNVIDAASDRGDSIVYRKFIDENISGYFLAVGGLCGINNAAQGNLTLSNIIMDNLSITGTNRSGGMFGYIDLNKNSNTVKVSDCTSDDLKINSGLYAAGIVGRIRGCKFNVENTNIVFTSIKIDPFCSSSYPFGWDKNGAGGIVGFIDNIGGLDFSNVNVGSELKSAYIGYSDRTKYLYNDNNKQTVMTGGMIGDTRTSADMRIASCYVYNLNLYGHRVGGIIGHSKPGSMTAITIHDCHVINTLGDSVRIYGDAGDTGDAAGGNYYDDGGNAGIIGCVRKTKANVTSCSIEGYNIYGYRATGAVFGGIIQEDDSDLFLADCTVINTNFYCRFDFGGIVGRTTSLLNGYNIHMKNIIFNKFPGYEYTDNTVYGKIIGRRYGNNVDNKPIKIAGISLQGDIPECELVGVSRKQGNSQNAGTVSSYSYGTDGYIVFADYDDKTSAVQNKDHANMYACENDVLGHKAVGSKITVTDYTVIAKKDENGNSVIQSMESIGESTVTNSDDIITGLTAGEKNISATGTKVGYEDVAMSVENMDQVSSVEELTADPTQGFYLQVNGYFITGVYTGNNGYFQKENSASNAILWYFEENSDNNTYRIYTYVGDEKKYLSRQFGKGGYISIYKDEAEGKNDNSSDHWDRDVSITCSQSLFTLQLLCSNHTQYTYFGTNGSYPINRTQNDNTKFKIYKSMTTEQLRVSDFSSTTFNTSSTEMSGTTSNGSAATSTQQTDYESALTAAGLDPNDHSYEIYTITQIVAENVYEYGKNKSPYVTTNPKFSVTSGQFLTGDGVSSALYSGSAFKHIVDDRAANTNKSYKVFDYLLGDGETYADALANIRSELSTASNEYKGYFAQHEGSGIKNFPLLVAEDTNRVTLTRTINNYLRALTNTNYNFADQTKTAIFEVGLYKCTFNEGTHEFDVNTSEACLKNEPIQGEYYFKMDAGDVDTRDIPQFTLMDVKFKNPANTYQIAYHLFVPVYVKKVLRYDFNAEIKSGTDYYWSAYSKLGSGMSQQGLFENLGNSVTIAFEFAYDRKPDEWVSALNGGDSLLTNYYKSLNLKNHNNNDWAADTKMVLIDANNSDKYYYLDSPPKGLLTTISLYDFTDEAGKHYVPVNLQELMTVAVEQNNDGTLTPTTGNTSEGATVFDGTKYYRPIDDEETVAETDRFTVTSVSDIKTERYYLSIFTKADENNNAVYRYEISSPESFAITGTGVMTGGTWTVNNWRANKIDKNTIITLFTGKLYENGLTLKVAPKQGSTQAMSASNNFLTVDMKATVALTQNAKSSGVGSNMYSFRNNAAIYQTFLMMYDKLATVGGSHEIGIDTAANAKVGIDSYFFANGIISDDLTASNATAVSDQSSKKVESAKYIELRNEQNLIEMLGSDSNAATLQVNFDMVYAADDLSTQFPKRDPDDNAQSSLGAKVIGYSKIASTVESAANSATYVKETDDQLYYTTTESTATLTYNVEPTPDNAAGQYSYLGINSVETGDAEMFVDTYAVYDTHRLTNPGNFIELTLTLSDKGDGYVTPATGKPINSGTALNIGEHLTELKIYGADGDDADSDDDVIFDQTASDVSADTKVTQKSNNIYTVRVRKNLLKTKSDGVYVIPITYKVKTGNTLFKSDGKKYANYKVSLAAAIYSSISSSNYSKSSYAFDHIIYTNARVLTAVVN